MNEKAVLDAAAWEKVEQIYHEALTLKKEEQDAYVAQACADDPVLYQEIVSLLTADKSSEGFLKEPIFVQGLRLLADDQAWQNIMPVAPTIAAISDLKSGFTLSDRYEIIDRIGGGGMGDVYKACDQRMLNRPVVVKVLKADVSNNEWLVKKFKQEIEASNKINTPGVVSFYDVGELPDGRPYLVMQYVEGQDLRKAIPSDRGMPLDEVAEIIKQIGRTLNIAHEKGIIHRDLKPENIMFCRDENDDIHVKVIDFGIAKIKASIVAASTSTDRSIGTPIYMSPEQLNPEQQYKRNISAASDIYSLGVIAYEMVTGRRPFNAETAIQLAALQREGVQVMPRALRPALPEAAQKVILKALSYHPAERYQRVRDFCNDLSQALLTEEVEPAQNPIQNPVSILIPQEADTLKKPRPAKRRRWLLAVATTLLLLLTSMAVGLWWKYGRPGPERSFSYSLKVQKVRDGKPYEQPFISSGREVYEKGYKFQLMVNTQANGYVYLFNEGKDDNGRFVFNILFPTPKRNGGSARLAADSTVETGWNEFGGQTGTELVWFVWTERPLVELEDARAVAFNNNGRVNEEASISRLRTFLNSRDSSRAEATKDTQQQRTVLRGHGDVVIYPLSLEYR